MEYIEDKVQQKKMEIYEFGYQIKWNTQLSLSSKNRLKMYLFQCCRNFIHSNL